MEAHLFALIVSLLVSTPSVRAQELELVDTASEAQFRCEKISEFMRLETQRLELYRKLDDNFAAYEAVRDKLPAEALQVLGAHRFFALMRSEYLPADLMGRVQGWKIKIDKSLEKLRRRLGDEAMGQIWHAYQILQERADLVEALAKLHKEQSSSGLEVIRDLETSLMSRGASFTAFDPSQPQGCL